MKKEQFDESVNRALYQASRNMELNETLRYLEDDVNKNELKAKRDLRPGRKRHDKCREICAMWAKFYPILQDWGWLDSFMFAYRRPLG